jgi:uncharacterized protein YjbJ (UPF0337 family)
MSVLDKVKTAVETTRGKAKVAAGRATDNPRLKTKGKGTLIKSNIRQAGTKIKDATKR